LVHPGIAVREVGRDEPGLIQTRAIDPGSTETAGSLGRDGEPQREKVAASRMK
jgi:hypothetical protein